MVLEPTEEAPNEALRMPVVLAVKAEVPTAAFEAPVVVEVRDKAPTATFEAAVVKAEPAVCPTAVLEFPDVAEAMAPLPRAVLPTPVVAEARAPIPTTTLLAPELGPLPTRTVLMKESFAIPTPPEIMTEPVEELVEAVVLVIVGTPVKVCVPVKVCAASVRARVAFVLGPVNVTPSVPARVMELDTVKVLPSATASVELVAGAVMAILLMLVAVATPSTGVTSVGVLANTAEPVPVSLESTPASCAEVVEANTERLSPVYATVPPAPKATELASVPVKVRVLETVAVFPSAIVSTAEVAGAVIVTLLTLVAEATPSTGVTSVGEVANTAAPDPVSSERAVFNSRLVAVRVLFVRLKVLLVNVSVPVSVAIVNPLVEGAVMVTPAGIVNVPVVEVIVNPLYVLPVRVPPVITAFLTALFTVTFL